MGRLHIVRGMGLVARYECLDMHGYIVEVLISYSPDRLAFWPKLDERGNELEEILGLRGAYILRRIFQLTGIKGVWISPHEVIVQRENWVSWNKLEDQIISIVKDGLSFSESYAEEIIEENILSPLEEEQLLILHEYYRGC